MFLRSFRCLVPQLRITTTNGRFLPFTQGSRSICDRALLKLDMFDKEKTRFASRISDLDSFWLRIISLDRVLEEDLKQAWVLADENELSTVIELSEKFFQNQPLFSTFRFGPLMMRTCHYLRKPETALEIFRNPKLTKLFDDAPSILLLMDLLYESGKFEDAVAVYEYLCEIEWYFVLRHPFVAMLHVISLYKQGTKESLLKAQQCLRRVYVSPNIKAKLETIVAGLALKLNDPRTAVNLVHRKALESELAFNIKIQGHIMLSEWDKVLKDLKHLKHHSLYEDTLMLILSSGEHLGQTSHLKSLKTTVGEKIVTPLTLHDIQEVRVSKKKKFYD
ncbi:Pentatricopeptide repeat-containing protein 2, mitochondrial [Frankliniella fusca]|uniref:Pentatricopeptide repeat-containing protein 2, mitochondrial n=1 Tax=Frankliniella fusca TaxID=407009 RepID=A0AAE1LPR1_9NEOP|nr:Pentatricopeptide repeat-containing protein 2, mitochondrial [Frankliniella fusca]